jgi:hypothetical protein
LDWAAVFFRCFEHERDFEDLETYFISIIPKTDEQLISFELCRGDNISLFIYPTVIDPKNRILGGKCLELQSEELGSALKAVGWHIETISILRDKLRKTNCKSISVSAGQGGWGKYSYAIFPKPISDSMIAVFGKPLGTSAFAKRVSLNYVAAL